jgi:predicted RNA binding protein YcfA (HicA-like mRNA interferase family)
MAKLPNISGSEAVKKFSKIGYQVIRQKGSHLRLRHFDSSKQPITIPLHPSLKPGLLRHLIHSTGLTVQEFIDL